MKKRFLAVILAALMALSPLVVTPVSADDTSGDWEYTVEDGEATIKRYTGTSTNVTIPNTISGYPVTKLSDFKPDDHSSYGIFYDCPTTNVVIPNSVTEIGYRSFSNCFSLKSVTIPNSVKIIGKNAFLNCTSLTSITIPYSVTTIEEHPFSGCYALTRIDVDPKNTSYKSSEGVLYSKDGTKLICFPCKNTISDFIIPGAVTSISEYAFRNCSILQSVTIPYGVTIISKGAFSYCTSLTDVSIPNSVTSIGAFAFEHTSIKDLILSDNLTTIGRQALYESALYRDSSNWENGVLYIGHHMIEAKSSISGSYTIKSGTKTIGDSAFSYCTSLTSVTIPDSVTSIGSWAFSACASLTMVYYTGSEDQWNSIKKGSNNDPLLNAKLVLPDNIDTTAPAGSISSTNNVAASQTVTLTLSDNVAVAGYYWGTSSSYTSNTYTATSNPSVTKTVSSNGTYYLTVKDTSGNVSSNYSITFYKTTLNANNGSVSPTSVLTESGKSFTFPTPTRSGYTYNGWSTSSTATSGVTTLSPTGNATYYAVWTFIDTIVPTGSISSTNNIAVSQTVTLTLSDNVGVAGYYWGTSSNYTSNTYTATSNSSVTKTVSSSGTYYLTVKDTSGNLSSNYSITFYKTTLDASGGSVSPASVLAESEESLTFPTPTRSGYSFDGWYTLVSGGTRITGATTITSSTTLYAHWSISSARGDVNKDTKINSRDVIVLMKYIVGSVPKDFVVSAADINGDKKINSRDVIALMKYIIDPVKFPIAGSVDPDELPDSDNDGIPDELEELLGLDGSTTDTDGDCLTDYQELCIVGTDPNKYDTDGDGISDSNDDEDGDGLSNSKEIELGTNPIAADTDFDGLSDGDEINTYKTNPLLYDTDGDTLSDSEEIKIGLDPNKKTTDGKTPDNRRSFSQTASDEIKDPYLLESDNWLSPTISGNVIGDISQHVELTTSDNESFNENRSVLSDVIDISTDYDCPLTLTFEYDKAYTGDDRKLSIMSFDEENGLVIVDTTVDESNHTISGEISGSSTYFVIDLDEFLKGLGIDVFANVKSATGIKSNSSVPTRSSFRTYASSKASSGATGRADIVFVIDVTASMGDAIGNVKTNINAFADKLASDYNIDANYGLIEFQDITNDGLDSTIRHQNMTSNWFTNVSTFKREIDGLKLGYGGD